jgi:hypothetical protein
VDQAITAAKKQDKPDDQSIPLYTQYTMNKGQWHVRQQVFGVEVKLKVSKFKKGFNAVIAPRMVRVDGEPYGRSYVEEYYGDLQNLEKLTEAIQSSALAASRLLWLIDPNGVTDADDLRDAENLDIILGNREDVSALQTEKYADLQTAYSALRDLGDRLEKAFLLTTAIQRDAERVTAEEVRRVHSELEEVLGGIHSTLTMELIAPYVEVRLTITLKNMPIPNLPPEVKPLILTGVEALGRGSELANLRGFLQDVQALAQTLPDKVVQEEIATSVDFASILKKLATGRSLHADDVLRKKVEKQAAQEQMVTDNLAEQVAPDLLKQATAGMM